MKITIIGTGYVGLVTSTCLAQMGNSVICVDKDEDKIDQLNSCICPIFEPGLENLVKNNFAAGRLSFTTDLARAVKSADAVFIAVGTPTLKDGNSDLSYIKSAAKTMFSGDPPPVPTIRPVRGLRTGSSLTPESTTASFIAR